MPGHGPAGFRASGDRLCAGPVAAGIKSLKLYLASFRNHGAFHEDCTVAIGKRIAASRAEMAAHRRLLVSARRHPDRRVLADRQAAEGHVDAGPGRGALSRPGLNRTARHIDHRICKSPSPPSSELPPLRVSSGRFERQRRARCRPRIAISPRAMRRSRKSRNCTTTERPMTPRRPKDRWRRSTRRR